MKLPDNPIRPVAHTDSSYMRFLFDAMSVVADYEPAVREKIGDKDLPRGKWHPNGFAVFNMEDIAGLGRLRLHFWPRDKRVFFRGHPPVHSHSFHLYSKVLEGEYKDSEYGVTFLHERPTRRHNTGRKYVIEYGRPEDGDVIKATDEWATMDQNKPRFCYPAGNWHAMASGDFHSTPIRPGEFCSTLLVMSPREHGDDVLVGSPRFRDRSYARPVVSGEDVSLMCNQFVTAAATSATGAANTRRIFPMQGPDQSARLWTPRSAQTPNPGEQPPPGRGF